MRQELVRPILLLVLALLFTVTVAWTLIVPGPFDWHIRQPQAEQGFLEFVVLIGLVYAMLRVPLRSELGRIALLLLPLAVYLRRHHVDLALLHALIYLEGLIALGTLARAASRSQEHAPDAWLRDLIGGIALLSLLLWSAQALGHGLAREQRVLACAALLPGLVLFRRRLQSVAMLRLAVVPRSRTEHAWIAIMIAFVAMQFARSNGVWDSDSTWYGFRPDRVLVGEHSVFEPLGYAAPVYYFPKLFEVLLLPLSASRDHSVVQGGSILLAACLARVAFALLERLQVASPLRLALVLAAWTIPALANTSLGAKPDVFVALLIVAMVWFGWNIAEGRRADLRWVFACAGLAAAAKLIAIPYVGVAGIACLLAAWRSDRATRATREPFAWWVLAAAALVGTMVCARTYLLTGLPTVGPEQLVELWRALGMQLKLPVGELTWVRPQVWSDLPVIALGWLAYPSLFTLIIVTWPSNVWVFLPLAALVCGRAVRSDPAPRWLLWAVPLAGLAMLVGIGFSNRGGDGNYFIAPVILATVAGGGLLARRQLSRRSHAALMMSLGLFVLLHLGYGFVSASWAIGTRTLDLDFDRANRDMPAQTSAMLANHSLDGVAAYLRNVHGSRLRMVGLLPYGMGNHLPARYEEINEVALTHLGKNRLVQMQILLSCGNVRAILLPQARPEPTPYIGAQTFIDWAYTLPASDDLYADEHWRLIAVSGMQACPTSTSQPRG
jgi:hypothetical protein